MEIPVIYIFTHDSIGVGEDGPTHQPVEQLAHMRSMPGLITIRPCDANEVREAWKLVLQLHHEPAVLVLTRQAVPTIDRSRYAAASGLARGAYVLADAAGADPEVILIGTGSEVSLCLEAYEQLTREGVRARVVSMPSWELFDDQDSEYRNSVLPPHVKARVSVEQASDFGWTKYTGTEGCHIGIETFGASAPLKQLQKKFGFTADNILAVARSQIARHRQ
jgi:transketolase